MKPEIFEFEIVVSASAIDDMNHVNNLQYLEWCLDAASRHWQRNTSEEIRKAFVWYVIKHEISYHAAAFEGETLLIRTWVNYSEGVKSEREYAIRRKSDDKLLVEAKTLWCLLNAETQRPAKITDEIRNLFVKAEDNEDN